jgi:hypothetical protein
MNTVMRILLRPCKKTTELIDKQMFTLNVKRKIQLQAHKAMCNTCNAYEAQSKLIDAIIGKWFITNSTQRKAALDEDKKQNY